MKQVSSVTDKDINRKNGALSVLVLVPLYLIACSGPPPDSMRAQEDRRATDTQATEIVINSEGEQLFKLRCGTCHSVEPGKPSVVGPSLAKVFGRSAGSVKGFAFSAAMQAYGKKWNVENMDKFLERPNEVIPGNRMAFAGLRNAEQRKLIIEYLEMFK